VRTGALFVLLACAHAGVASGQGATEARLREQRDELDRIRQERDSLLAESRQIQGRVRSLSDEVTLIGRQREATNRLLRTLDRQLASVNVEVDTANARVAAAQAEVGQRRERLRGRVRDIYKRGPLFATEAFLAARSFGELVARYKYLHELTLYDKAVVKRVEDLHRQIDGQRQLLVRLQDEFERGREEKAREQRRLRDLEVQQQRALSQAKRSQQEIDARLAQMRRDEARLANLIASMEAAARAGGGGAGAPRRARSRRRTTATWTGRWKATSCTTSAGRSTRTTRRSAGTASASRRR
jgi:peptidoglycan hydrolase CwlO-like protein